MRGYPAIAEYGIIGNCRTAALVSRDGALDWLCLPRFDGPSVFGALLDADRGGRFAVRPVGGFAVERRYVGPTNVLETTFTTDRGRLRLIDDLPVATDEDKRAVLVPEHEILRVLECVEGEIEVEVVYDPRPGYATLVPTPRAGWSAGRRGACRRLEGGSS